MVKFAAHGEKWDNTSESDDERRKDQSGRRRLYIPTYVGKSLNWYLVWAAQELVILFAWNIFSVKFHVQNMELEWK